MSDRRSQLHSLSIDRQDDETGRSGLGLVPVLVLILLAAGLSAGATWYFVGGNEPAPIATPAPAPAPVETAETGAAQPLRDW